MTVKHFFIVEIKDKDYNIIEVKHFNEYEDAQKFIQKLELSQEVKQGYKNFDFYRSDVV